MLRQLIQQKQEHSPMQVYPDQVKKIATEIDHFPYLKFYRGEYLDTNPHVFSRNAGYSTLKNQKYYIDTSVDKTEKDWQVPFQIPCSTILPRYVKTTYDPRQSNIDSLSYR